MFLESFPFPESIGFLFVSATSLQYDNYRSVCVTPYGVSTLCVLTSPYPAGYLPSVCSNVPGCGPLSRERRMSVAAELTSGAKLV